MPAEAAELRFFVDESALGLGKTLAAARRDVIHAGHVLIPEAPLGTIDPVWIPAVAARGLVVIARDKRIRTKPAELALLREHGMRVLWIAGKRDLSTWDAIARMIHRWDDIETIMAERGPGPWFMAVLERSIREIAV